MTNIRLSKHKALVSFYQNNINNELLQSWLLRRVPIPSIIPTVSVMLKVEHHSTYHDRQKGSSPSVERNTIKGSSNLQLKIFGGDGS